MTANMNENPYQSPAPSDHDPGKSVFSVELFSILLWSNIGFVAICLLFFGLDWLYVNWGGTDAREVHIAWSKLFFIMIGANVIIFFTYINRVNDQANT